MLPERSQFPASRAPLGVLEPEGIGPPPLPQPVRVAAPARQIITANAVFTERGFRLFVIMIEQ